jgi:aminoglycoside/choline kinase family phosphotransferase
LFDKKMGMTRDEQMRDFLAASGWGDAVVTPLPGDASTRSYARLRHGARQALLMNQPQGAEAPVAPANASAEERHALGYNAVARLAGADIGRFAAVAQHLRDAGLSAPEIHAADNAAGFMVLEDLGDGLFADVVAGGGDECALYLNAMEVLARLHAQAAPEQMNAKPLFVYDETALLAEADLLTEWYFPHALGRAATAAEVAEHRALWRAALAPVLAAPRVFVHRDFHAQNLLWLPQRQGASRTGLIDFQDAVAGNRAYDLVSLLEDARRDVDATVAEAAVRHYLDTMTAQGTPLDEAAFRAEMAAIAAQRNAKIVGIFARLFKRDGKPRYLDYLPRVWGHLTGDLSHPSLAGLRTWYDRTIPKENRQ